ncbi:hypothetical protein KYK29_06050 [Shinella daejeonensis]|uniref:capsular polysaccharide export protein, LipB/KpsS family n=1 Tax=Shinella daejeonensis TaxID=659017 RepID=UPI0020C799E8|nr:hypothetical protein [Shinella daejeonensis]MCP8894488.1 hypothetical protein [Shinella daejeonensis]
MRDHFQNSTSQTDGQSMNAGSQAISTKRLPVSLEVPEAWFRNPLDGDRHRQMFTVLSVALAKLPTDVKLSIVTWGSYRAPRSAPKGGATFSFHSIGNVENVWRIKETSIAGFYSFDASGYSGWSSLSRSPETHRNRIASKNIIAAEKFVSSLKENLRRGNLSKYRQSDEPFRSDKPYVYFPLQLLDDPVSEFNRIQPLVVLDKAAELADQSDVALVVKRHPLCRNELVTRALAEVVNRYRNVQVSSASVHLHLESCQAVLIGNSGVGLEALLYGKPIFSFASSEYESVTTWLHDVEDIEKAFTDQSSISDEQRKKFLAYYLDECCFSIYDQQSVDRRVNEALSNLTASEGPLPEDSNSALFAAYGQIEQLRSANMQMQAEIAKLREIAEEAVKLSSAHSEMDRPSQRQRDENARAVEFALMLQHSSLENQINNKAIKRITNEAYSAYAALAINLHENGSLRDAIDSELLRSGYASGLDSSVRHRNITASDYQMLHDNDEGYQTNNWLVDHSDIIMSANPKTIVELGCGNGKFLHKIASSSVERIIGLDWARSPLLDELPSKVEFVQTNALTDEIYEGDICCSADVLEHFKPQDLPNIIHKLHHSAQINYHVIACYDDGHSHCAVLHPGQWLALFKTISQRYELAAIIPRRGRPDQIVCVITNLPGAASFFSRMENFVGTWITDTGQSVTLDENFRVLVQGQQQASWVKINDDLACLSWNNRKMIDLAEVVDDHSRLSILNLNGDRFSVKRGA